MYRTISWLTLALNVAGADAAYMTFQNCLSPNVITSNPKFLQFTPLNVTATLNTTASSHGLNVTVYGNVSGLTTVQSYPAINSSSWSDPNNPLGKIVNVSPTNNKYTTLLYRLNVLNYMPYQAPASPFCQSVVNDQCPLGPAFYANSTDLAQLPAFSVSSDLYSTYAFTSITANLQIISGDVNNQTLACISATITPELGTSLSGTLTYLPLMVLIMVALATVCAAIFSPWGSSDIFRWTSNFGRDEDLLRLVTPGFGDCLQYIQFIVLTGSLSLNYPGFFQPVVSRVGWSSLMFNESFVTRGNGTQSAVDGLYQIQPNTTYGLDSMSQLIGMTSVTDVWAGMVVWLVVITAAVAVLTQLAFGLRWLYRQVASIPPEDLRSKNWPFTAGNIIRTVFSYFLLPLVSLSMFQLVIANQGPTYSVVLAAFVLVIVTAFAFRLMFLFSRTRPRSFLFDDMPTLLTYGPLYNTYNDDAATFAMIPIFINFLRGIAIGAVQPSGIAQLVLLAICEIMLLLTINAFRPYPFATSMNIYHTFITVTRLAIILLSISFVPALGVADPSRGWIGYVILLIHAAVLVFGFFLNAVQTLIEVLARMAGAGGHGELGAARGGLSKVFGMRQLSRRTPRRDRDQQSRYSTASNAGMLGVDGDQKSLGLEQARSRSISASSTMLLNRADARHSQTFGGTPASYFDGQASPDGASTISKQLTDRRISGSHSPGGIMGLQQVEAKDPYYRPPRRNTMDPLTSSDKRPHVSVTSADRSKAKGTASEQDVEDDNGEGSSHAAGSQTQPVSQKDDLDDGGELTKTKTDYAVREVDFYYGVRGPALSSGTRKLKTGPADPTGPVSSATGWFKNLLGNKTKENGKGFEVVRSSRAPPPGLIPPTPDSSRPTPEPYRDDPDSPERRRGVPAHEAELDASGAPYSDSDLESIPRAPARPPSLPLIDSGGDIELPSRMGSQSSTVVKRPGRRPDMPRRSSRRASSQDQAADTAVFPSPHLSTVAASPQSSPQPRQGGQQLRASASSRLPFTSDTADETPMKSNRYSTGANSMASSMMQIPGDEENHDPLSYTHRARHSSSVLGIHAPDLQADRPSSMGYVAQHRASDNIHHSPESTEFTGSSAEVLGRPLR